MKSAAVLKNDHFDERTFLLSPMASDTPDEKVGLLRVVLSFSSEKNEMLKKENDHIHYFVLKRNDARMRSRTKDKNRFQTSTTGFVCSQNTVSSDL